MPQNETMGEWPEEVDPDNDDPMDVLSDKEYLIHLAERIRHIPAMYEVDDYDISRLLNMAAEMPEPPCQHDWAHGFGGMGIPTLTCKKCGEFQWD